MRSRIAAADMQADRHVERVDLLEERIPIVVVNARQADDGRILIDRDRMAPLGGNALHLGKRGVHVPAREDTARNEPARIGAAPFVDVPIVIGREVPRRELLVGRAGKPATREVEHAAEIQRRRDAIDVHVLDPRVNIVDALAHLRERGRLHAVFLERTADYGVEPDARELLPLVDPHLAAGGVGHQLGRRCQVRAGQVIVEQVRGFADVIINTDDHHIVHFHGLTLLCCLSI